jgi:hypothetical protein
MKRIVLAAVAAMLLFGISACGNAGTVKNTPVPGSTGQTAAYTDPTIDSGGGLEWPEEYMGSLPVPQSKISRIERLNGTEKLPETDTTTEPSSVNVVMNEMTKEQALDYYNRLKEAGLTINQDKKDDRKILLAGALGGDMQSLFLFSYEEAYHLGNVSITFPSVVSGGD